VTNLFDCNPQSLLIILYVCICSNK